MKTLLSFVVVLISAFSGIWTYIKSDFVTPVEIRPTEQKFELSENNVGLFDEVKP